MGQKPIPPAPPVIAATLPAPAQTEPAATQPPVVIRNYGQLLSAELRNYPSTQPWAVPVELPDAAHIILHDPVYVCSRGDLWITRPDADPLATVLARAGDESEHLVDRRIEYIVWSINRRGVYEPSAICRSSAGFEWITAKDTAKPIPWQRPYHWDRALTWDDNGQTRLIVPTDDGVSMITLANPLTEDYCPLLAAATTRRDVPPPQILFDLKGLLAWIPADGDFAPGSKVARYLDGKWIDLDSTNWPGNIVHLIPMLDGSVLQIRRGADAGTVSLMIVPLDNPAIDQNEISDLTDQLGDDDPDKRTKAFEELTRYGPGIYPILEKLSPSASPEAQARIREILEGRLQTTLGGMLVNADQLSVHARLRDGGVVFLASQGVSIPRPDQDPKIISPDELVVRPGRPVQELPAAIVDQLGKNGGTIAAFNDEWVLTTPGGVGPQRYLPPQEFVPLLRDSEKNFSRLEAIDRRGRWLFGEANSSGSSAGATLILDPTVPDPTPRMAIWLVNSGEDSGWNKDDWPAITRGTAHWIIDDHGWEPMDASDQVRHDPPPMPPPATLPSTAPDNGPLLLADSAGNRYFDGLMTLTVLTAKGKRFVWQLPTEAASVDQQVAHLAEDRDGHLFLFNSIGRIARFRKTLDDSQPFVLEAVFSNQVPDFGEIARAWCDPAGRIAVVYAGSRLALIFPSGQLPPAISDKILPQDLRRPE
jgi:hypothetical protein